MDDIEINGKEILKRYWVGYNKIEKRGNKIGKLLELYDRQKRMVVNQQFVELKHLMTKKQINRIKKYFIYKVKQYESKQEVL